METKRGYQPHAPWNKGKPAGQKAPLKLKEIWPFASTYKCAPTGAVQLAIDSKLRGCDLVRLHVQDVSQGGLFPGNHRAA